ncbi:MAG TPA: ABC transporter substrate-binding protein [candidate division Zixibacteria bacterium]|nr:ABC transporter substrate-binding protein [candidate division Zixibacteria bacterium]
MKGTFPGIRAALVAAALLAGGLPAAAGEPTEEIRAAISQGVEVLKNAKLGDAQSRAAALDRLRRIVYPLFDFPEMARRSLGTHWRRLEPQQQKRFVTVFTALLEATYADKIDLYEGQKVLYVGESIDQNYARVQTRVVGKDEQSYSVEYRLHRLDGRWRIYDVVAENISLVNNYRSQFQRVLARSSFDELIKRMEQKSG